MKGVDNREPCTSGRQGMSIMKLVGSRRNHESGSEESGIIQTKVPKTAAAKGNTGRKGDVSTWTDRRAGNFNFRVPSIFYSKGWAL